MEEDKQQVASEENRYLEMEFSKNGHDEFDYMQYRQNEVGYGQYRQNELNHDQYKQNEIDYNQYKQNEPNDYEGDPDTLAEKFMDFGQHQEGQGAEKKYFYNENIEKSTGNWSPPNVHNPFIIMRNTNNYNEIPSNRNSIPRGQDQNIDTTGAYLALCLRVEKQLLEVLKNLRVEQAGNPYAEKKLAVKKLEEFFSLDLSKKRYKSGTLLKLQFLLGRLDHRRAEELNELIKAIYCCEIVCVMTNEQKMIDEGVRNGSEELRRRFQKGFEEVVRTVREKLTSKEMMEVLRKEFMKSRYAGHKYGQKKEGKRNIEPVMSKEEISKKQESAWKFLKTELRI